MPQLLNGKRIDFNPDNIVQANKILSSRINENLKNALKDTDYKTLSNIDAERRLSDNIDMIKEMMGEYRNILMRIKTYFATAIQKDRGFGIDINDVAFDDLSLGSGRKKGRGGKKGGVRVDVDNELNELRRRRQLASAGLGLFGGSSNDEESSRFSHHFTNEDMDFQATGDTSNMSSNASQMFSPIRNRPEIFETGVSTGSISLALFYRLIQLTRKIDIFIISKIKPSIRVLNQGDISVLVELFNLVKNAYEEIVFPFKSQVSRGKKGVNESIEAFIANKVEYGDEMLDTFNREREKLLVDLTIVINSWKQNTPTGEQTQLGENLQKEFSDISRTLGDDITGYIAPSRLSVKQSVDETIGSGRHCKMGGGRNFYGDIVNESRDIPTIWGHLRNCPTKYML